MEGEARILYILMGINRILMFGFLELTNSWAILIILDVRFAHLS